LYFFPLPQGHSSFLPGFTYTCLIVVCHRRFPTGARLIAAPNRVFGVESAPFLRSKVDPQIESRDP
jgi:hypothetical protein